MSGRRFLSQSQATIDLHGLSKSDALRRLTLFMEQISCQNPRSASNVWVLVITGSGAHSSSGPILRTAVETLFQKRSMKYVLNPGKGSFTVDVKSGFKIFEPDQPQDTKVILSKETTRGRSFLSSHRDRVRTAPRMDEENNPLPAEVAATDAFIEESKMEGQKMIGLQKKEEAMFHRAVSMSVLEIKEEKEAESELLQRAMALSIIENLPQPSDDEEDIQKALELSKQEFEQEQETDPLQEALELSRQVVCQEDEDLLKILEQSKVQY
eukprot:scaffold7017_cov134-Cylindrotheca_fusiformis.AAC.28